jgi:hypothetical protein
VQKEIDALEPELAGFKVKMREHLTGRRKYGVS